MKTNSTCLLFLACLVMGTQSIASARAAVTRIRLLACHDEKIFDKQRRPADKDKARTDAAASGRGGNESGCIHPAAGTTVEIDLRKPPLMCVRLVGDLDCYWTQADWIDEFPPQQGAGGHPGEGGGGGKRRH